MTVYSVCREMHSLPKTGGLYEQDSYFVFLMTYALACEEEKRQIDEIKRKSAGDG